MRRELYGGAAIAEIEESFIDCTDLRPVPDTQEMFSNFDTKEGIIFDLLEFVNVSDEDAAKVHFDELSTIVGSLENKILNIETLKEFPNFK
jgi:hypothetical protein